MVRTAPFNNGGTVVEFGPVPVAVSGTRYCERCGERGEVAIDQEVDNLAFPLDALLIDASLGTARRFLPNSSMVKWGFALARRPAVTARRLGGMANELRRIAVGSSTVEPSKRDRDLIMGEIHRIIREEGSVRS